MKKYLGQTVILMLGILLGVVCGIMIARGMKASDMYGGALLLTELLILYGALFLQLILHEAGHLVFGLLTGYRFMSFRICNWIWIMQDGRIRLRRYSLGGTGGQCLMRPPEMREGRFPVILYNFGGSIMNLLVSLLCLAAWAIAGDGAILKSCLMAMAILGIHSALTNGIPLETKLIANDGKNAMALRKDADERYGFWLQLEIHARIAQGQALRQMPAEWFQMPADEQMKKRHTAVRGVLACNRMLEELRFAETAAEIQRLLSLDSAIIGIHRGQLTCDLITCMLIQGNELGEASALLDKNQKRMMKALAKLPSTLRTQYAIALRLEKDATQADETLKQFERIAKNYPYPAEIESERALIRAIEGKTE